MRNERGKPKMSRTEELRGGGARRIGGGSDHPFLKWPDKGGASHAYVEGPVTAIWAGKYGQNLTIVAEHGQAIRAVSGGEEQTEYKIEAGMELNVSLGYSALKEAADEIQIGNSYHIAFTGWEKSKKGGNEYRMFEVYDLGSAESEPEMEDTSDGNPPWHDEPDDLPF